jgi:hypothetical protein
LSRRGVWQYALCRRITIWLGVPYGRAYCHTPLQQILAVEHRRFQRKGIDTVHAAEVHDILPRPPGRLAEGVDAAGLAEIVLRLLLAELVKIQRTFLRVDMELRPRHGMHHRSPLGTERAIAAYPLGDRFRLEREVDRAAVATAFVWLHYHSSIPSSFSW